MRYKFACQRGAEAVRQMSAGRKRHSQDGVSGLESADVDCLVCLSCRMRLDVRLGKTEQQLASIFYNELQCIDSVGARKPALADPTLDRLHVAGICRGHHHVQTWHALGSHQVDVHRLSAKLAAN